MGKLELGILEQVAKGLAGQFGSQCEVVVHDLSAKSPEHSIAVIENGHVTGRKLGDGASDIVMHQLKDGDDAAEDQLGYLTRTADGRVLKSSSIYVRNSRGKVTAILSINYDITALTVAQHAVEELVTARGNGHDEPVTITNVSDLLNDLLQQSVALVGKPVSMMNKKDKVKAIEFLNQNGAFRIMKAGNIIARHFGISLYTVYSYLDLKEKDN